MQYRREQRWKTSSVKCYRIVLRRRITIFLHLHHYSQYVNYSLEFSSSKMIFALVTSLLDHRATVYHLSQIDPHHRFRKFFI